MGSQKPPDAAIANKEAQHSPEAKKCEMRLHYETVAWHAWSGIMRRGVSPIGFGPLPFFCNASQLSQQRLAMGGDLGLFRATHTLDVQHMLLQGLFGIAYNNPPY